MDSEGAAEFHVIGINTQNEQLSEFRVVDDSPLGGMNLAGLYPSPSKEYLALELVHPMGGYAEVKIVELSSKRVFCPLDTSQGCWGGFSGWVSNDQFLFQPFDVPPEGVISLGVISINIITGQYQPLDLPVSPDGVYSLAQNISSNLEGTQVAYSITSSKDGQLTSEIWILPIKGIEKQLIHSVRGLVTGLAWSPVDSHLIYTYQGDPGSSPTAELWIVDTNGGNARLLATNIPESGELRFHPTWSPDGQYIVFAQVDRSVISDETDRRLIWSNVFVVSTITEHITPLSSFERHETSNFTWSPDSQSIAFMITHNGEGKTFASEVWVASVDGNQLDRIAANAKWNNALSWFPPLDSQE